ncbi:MAG: hypothetical protein GPJ50_12305 [Candidatus Heimdallarchaeota archaeon]|nr:hypothetical protein [Candidatus Heimdallarchaeota archaeon]
MATLEEINNLVEKIWMYLPGTGGGDSPWSSKEKDQVIEKVNKLKNKLATYEEDLKGQRKEVAKTFKLLDKQLSKFSNFAEVREKNFKEQFTLVIELLSSGMNLEDLERIEDKHKAEDKHKNSG